MEEKKIVHHKNNAGKGKERKRFGFLLTMTGRPPRPKNKNKRRIYLGIQQQQKDTMDGNQYRNQKILHTKLMILQFE